MFNCCSVWYVLVWPKWLCYIDRGYRHTYWFRVNLSGSHLVIRSSDNYVSMAGRNTPVSPLCWQWDYRRPAPSHQFDHGSRNQSQKFYCSTLHWRHNDHGGVSNHQPHDCLLITSLTVNICWQLQCFSLNKKFSNVSIEERKFNIRSIPPYEKQQTQGTGYCISLFSNSPWPLLPTDMSLTAT